VKPEEFRQRFFDGAPRYRWLDTLGRGGVGVVFKALDLELDDVVAIKVLQPDIERDDMALLARFKREINLNRRIKHPNVARIHDFGLSGNLPYITMEFLPGKDLWTMIQQKARLEPSEAVAILRQVARGSDAVHRLGIVHRDLKSQNVIVDEKGAAVIVDFGLARGNANEPFTLDSIIVGTPHYMSPEQAEGNDVDQRSDIYSIGVIAFEVLTGHPPFSGGSPIAVAMQHVSSPVPDDLAALPDVPRELRALVHKCLEKDPARRPSTAADLDADLALIQPTVTRSEKAVRQFQALWAPADTLVSALESRLEAIVVPTAEEHDEGADAGGARPPATVAMKKDPSVLVVNPRGPEASALAASLAEAGLHPMYAGNGHEALEMLLKRRVDFVVMDVDLPGIDGFDVTRVIRAQPQFAALPILLAAEQPDRRKLAFAIQSGATDLLARPIDIESLVSRVRRLLQHSSQSRPAAPAPSGEAAS
jgi:CheY-like chemotaxis protein